jgi:hypothetical protein
MNNGAVADFSSVILVPFGFNAASHLQQRCHGGFGADHARDVRAAVLVGKHLAHAHGNIRERGNLDLSRRHFQRQRLDECEGRLVAGACDIALVLG